MHTHTHTHTGFLPESDPAPVVQFFTRTGIAAAGGQCDFERCTRKMCVHRHRKRNLLVLLYLRRKYKKTRKTILGTSSFSCTVFGRKLLHALRLLNFIFITITGFIPQTRLALD